MQTRSIYYIQSGQRMLVLILPTPEGWKAERTIAGKKVTQIFNPRPGQGLNRGPQDWEAETFITAPTPPLNILSFTEALKSRISKVQGELFNNRNVQIMKMLFQLSMESLSD